MGLSGQVRIAIKDNSGTYRKLPDYEVLSLFFTFFTLVIFLQKIRLHDAVLFFYPKAYVANAFFCF